MIWHRFREWFAGRKSLVLFPLVLVVATAGCASSFHETHFFKYASERGGISNYFRLTVSGQTMLCSARYISGYFEEDIVNQYFNEIGQPDKGRLIPVGQSPKTEGTRNTEAKGEGTPTTSAKALQELKSPALVLLLSSNSDDIANQLGALAQSEEFTASLARLMASSRFEAANEAERRLRNDQARGRLVATLGDQLLMTLPDKPTADEVKNRVLEFVNHLGADLGAPVPFNNLKEAADWLGHNRSRLRQETRP
jgi:hypothetical protein